MPGWRWSACSGGWTTSAGCPVGITATTDNTKFYFEFKAIGLKAGSSKAPLRFSPSGSLGKRLLLRVSDVMRSGDRIPAVEPGVTLRDLGVYLLLDDFASWLRRKFRGSATAVASAQGTEGTQS